MVIIDGKHGKNFLAIGLFLRKACIEIKGLLFLK